MTSTEEMNLHPVADVAAAGETVQVPETGAGEHAFTFKLTFEHSLDPAIIKAVITHPAIYPFVGEDGSPAARDFEIPAPAAHLYILVRSHGRLGGLFAFTGITSCEFEVHTCLLPWIRGPLAVQAGKQMIQWIWRNTSAIRIRTAVPAYNRRALRFARWCGFERIGVDCQSYRKHGRVWDQTLLGVSKPIEVLPCP